MRVTERQAAADAEHEDRDAPLSVAARREAGFLLRQVQQGASLSLPRSRPMPSIGARCHELRIIDVDAILVVEIFSKKTQKTPLHVIELCQKRLREWDKGD